MSYSRKQSAVLLFSAIVAIVMMTALSACFWVSGGTTCDYDYCSGDGDGGGGYNNGGNWGNNGGYNNGGNWGNNGGGNGWGGNGSNNGSGNGYGGNGSNNGYNNGWSNNGGGNGYCDADGYCMQVGQDAVSRDLTTDIAEEEQAKIDEAGRHYAEKFSLSEEQGVKIAKAIYDYEVLKNRSDDDVAKFAKRLYGVEPTQIMVAVGKAQMGDAGAFNGVVNEAAKNFNTTPDNMRSIVKTIHGRLLKQQGIAF